MKLEKILDKLNTIEKTSFSKIIDGIISKRPKNIKEIDKILSTYSDVNLRRLDIRCDINDVVVRSHISQ